MVCKNTDELGAVRSELMHHDWTASDQPATVRYDGLCEARRLHEVNIQCSIRIRVRLVPDLALVRPSMCIPLHMMWRAKERMCGKLRLQTRGGCCGVLRTVATCVRRHWTTLLRDDGSLDRETGSRMWMWMRHRSLD